MTHTLNNKIFRITCLLRGFCLLGGLASWRLPLVVTQNIIFVVLSCGLVTKSSSFFYCSITALKSKVSLNLVISLFYCNSTIIGQNGCAKMKMDCLKFPSEQTTNTRMHSSRMRTARSLPYGGSLTRGSP